MTNKQLTVVVDADALVAQAMAQDSNNAQATAISGMLNAKGAKVIYPATAITEAVTTLQRKFSNPTLAAGTLSVFEDPTMIVEEVNHETIIEASQLFNPKGSKHNTVFDCVVAAVAKKHNADAIFSFDDWYTKLGFKLVADLIKPERNFGK